MKLTEKQEQLIQFYAEQAGLDYKTVLMWVRHGIVTITELSQGILGVLYSK